MLERHFIRLNYKDTKQLYDLSLLIAKGEMSISELKCFLVKYTTLNLTNMLFYNKFYGYTMSY